VTGKQKEQNYSKESEMMVLGNSINKKQHLFEAVNLLGVEDFYFSEHKKIFRALIDSRNAFSKNSQIPTVLQEKLGDSLLSIGGISYIISLSQYAKTSWDIIEYIHLVKENSFKRHINSLNCELLKITDEMSHWFLKRGIKWNR